MGILFATILAIVAVEYFYRIPFRLHIDKLIKLTSKSTHVALSRKISDHWKEIILLRYARDIAIHTIRLGVILIGGISVVVVPSMLLDYIFNATSSTIESFASLIGNLTILATTVFYVVIRKNLNK
jgi:hypothetical protein